MPSEQATLAIPVSVDDVPQRTRGRCRSRLTRRSPIRGRRMTPPARPSTWCRGRPRRPRRRRPPAGVGRGDLAAVGGGGPAAPSLALRLRQSRAQLLTNKFDVSVVASCGQVACSAEATGSVRIGGRTWRLRSVRGQIPAGRAVRLRVASTKALHRAARATRRPLRVTVIVTVRGTDGKVASQRVTVPVRVLRR